jgi:hypothetical protein
MKWNFYIYIAKISHIQLFEKHQLWLHFLLVIQILFLLKGPFNVTLFNLRLDLRILKHLVFLIQRYLIFQIFFNFISEARYGFDLLHCKGLGLTRHYLDRNFSVLLFFVLNLLLFLYLRWNILNLHWRKWS